MAQTIDGQAVEQNETDEGAPRLPLVRPGWVQFQLGYWVRASAVVEVSAENLPEPEASDGMRLITQVRAGGQELGSLYPTRVLLDALWRAEQLEAEVRAD